MATHQIIDWSNVKTAAENWAGNWRGFDSFCWSRGNDLDDSGKWLIFYTSNRDSGLLAKSNENEITKRLRAYSEGDDPDVVFESHSHWAVGFIDGFSLRVFKADGTITPAFVEFCRIQEKLEVYPVLNETDYCDREYEATLENYRGELWRLRDQLPEGWESEVYSWFSDNGMDQFTEDRDGSGGYAPREQIIEALESLGIYSTEADNPILVN